VGICYVGKRRKNMKTYRRKKSFLSDIERYGVKSVIKHRFRKLHLPRELIGIIVGLLIISVINNFYPVWIFATVFYILEIVVISYFMYRLLKRFERIRVRSDLSLFGLRALAGIIAGTGGFLVGIFMFFGFPLVLSGAIFGSDALLQTYEFMGLGCMIPIFTFGIDFHLPFMGTIFYVFVALWLIIIGGFLFFKFQRRTGQFVWFGRI